MKITRLEIKKLWLLAQNKRIEGQVNQELEHRWSIFAMKLTGMTLIVIWSFIALIWSFIALIHAIRG